MTPAWALLVTLAFTGASPEVAATARAPLVDVREAHGDGSGLDAAGAVLLMGSGAVVMSGAIGLLAGVGLTDPAFGDEERQRAGIVFLAFGGVVTAIGAMGLMSGAGLLVVDALLE